MRSLVAVAVGFQLDQGGGGAHDRAEDEVRRREAASSA
jgi:hypothetical protein